ncbi:MAG: SH3 domain-containing protein [Kiritimatiellia bacterium]
MKKTAALIIAALASALSAEAAGGRGQIIGDNVNLRAKDLPESEVVAQMNDGDMVEIKGYSGDWAEIVPPDSADLWVHKDFIEGGVVRSKTLNVRAGPGINFNVVGTMVRGDTLTIRGEMTEWYKIAPPATCSLWVNKEYVGSPSKPKPVEAAKPAPPRAPPPAPVRQTVTVPAPVRRPDEPRREPERAVRESVIIPPQVVSAEPAEEGMQSDVPANWKLIPLEGQGKRIERSGILKGVGWRLKRPSHFRLVRYLDSGRFETVCYVRGNRQQLTEWSGEEIGVRGREYWIQNEKYPIVVIDQLMLPARTRPQEPEMQQQTVPPIRPRMMPPQEIPPAEDEFEPTN